MSKYTVIFDACVLYPAPLRDILIELAKAQLFHAIWSEKIHEEWTRSVIARRPELEEKLKRTVRLMNETVPDCMVQGYEHLIPNIKLPDADDRHIVAAAIHARADGIITFNLKDFPAKELAAYNLEAIHPDEFIIAQTDLDEAALIMAAQRIRARLKKPPITSQKYLETLLAQQLPKTVAWLGPYAEII